MVTPDFAGSLQPAQVDMIKQFAEPFRDLSRAAFQGRKSFPKAAKLLRVVYDDADLMVTQVLKKRSPVPCKVGCFWCCYIRVEITPLEAIYIADFLRSNLWPSELAEVRQRIELVDQVTRGMNAHQRALAKGVCPLIKDGLCSIYPVRPVACRVYCSQSLPDCEHGFADADYGVTIHSDIFYAGGGVLAGLQEGLKAVGLQSRMLELAAGLAIALDEPGVVKKWLDGESVFEEAEIPEEKRA